jgi:MFS family permease
LIGLRYTLPRRATIKKRIFPTRPAFSAFWIVPLSAAGIFMVTMGTRQSLGLFVAPLSVQSGLDIAAISTALAIGQFVWGLVQPAAGALSDRYGPRRVLTGGLVLLATACALTPCMNGFWGLVFSIGILSAIGSGSGSFSVLIGAVSPAIPTHLRGMASGIINAGGSLGQSIFAPLLQRLIAAFGWMSAMGAMAAASLLVLPLVGKVAPRADETKSARPATASPVKASAAEILHGVRGAFANPGYLLLHCSFFTCGFHIAFLTTHLPNEIALCGLPPTVAGEMLALIGLANIGGSLFIGACTTRFLSKHILFWMYGSRALLNILYLALPKTNVSLLLFAAGFGLTWLATVPPTATIVGKLFGARHMGTLYGIIMLSHQTGGFLGAWLGGFSVTRFGDYTWVWVADMALAAFAALINLPIREPATLGETRAPDSRQSEQ